MQLTTKITSVLMQTCSLIVNTQNTQISLESICGQVYLKISCNLKDAILPMHSSIPDFFTTITIQENMRSVMRFYADASFVYQLICSCQPLSSSLKGSELLVTMNAQIPPITADTKFTNQIVKDIRRYSALGIAGDCKLSTAMTKELEMQYGLGYYDKRYLYQWDPYKLVDMSQQIVNQTYKAVSQRN